MDLRKIVTVPLTTKASEELRQTGEFSGYGSVFGSIDRGGDTIKRGAFANTIKSMQEKNQMPAMLWAHDATEPIGEWVEMREDERGLYVRGVLWVAGNTAGRAPVANAEKARNLMLANGPKGLSIGGTLAGADASEMVRMDGQEVRQIKEFALWEVSPCVFAMEPKAAVTDVKSITPRTLEKFLIDTGKFTRNEAKQCVSEAFSQRDVGSSHQRDVDDGSLSEADLAKIYDEISRNF